MIEPMLTGVPNRCVDAALYSMCNDMGEAPSGTKNTTAAPLRIQPAEELLVVP
jgi:hypothetical protein